MKAFKSLVSAVVLTAASSLAHAVPVTFFDTITNGQSQFNTTVTNAGGTVSSHTLSGLSFGSSWSFTDFTIANTDGGSSSVYGPSQNNSSGDMIGINPATPVAQSGITFTFNNPVNALGFEVGDWATCCFPSNLYIAFDGGATQQVAAASSSTDNPANANGNGFGDAFFVGAIDDSATFTSVVFYGDGIGEFLTAGGTILFSTVGIGSVNVPEPGTLAIVGLGLVAFSLRRRRA